MTVVQTRTFHCPDADLIAGGNTFHSLLSARFADFSSYDPVRFNAGYLERFRGIINEATGVGQDRDVVRKISQETLQMHMAQDEAVEAYEDLAYFIGKLARANPSIRNRFALDDFSELKRGHIEKLILFLENIENTIAEHIDILNAAGYTPEKRSHYILSVEALRMAKWEQDEALRLRATRTTDRIEAMNELHAVMIEISNAAEQVYKGDPAAIALFDMPRYPTPPKKDETEKAK